MHLNVTAYGLKSQATAVPGTCATVENMASAANPFSDPLRFERRVPECTIVIFGANGDLTKRKLLPALYRLAHDRRLPETFSIIGNSRTAMTDEAFRDHMCEAVKKFSEDTEFDQALWDRFSKNIFYIAGDMKDLGLYDSLAAKAAETKQKNLLFYLSTQPSYYEMVVDGLGHAKLNQGADGWRRIIVEKPFGHDL
ncbi:MAG: glucose-6-phosphate dehydrogenase, partial [Acidobacteriota bacterium]